MNPYADLQARALACNLRLPAAGLVTGTFGNASAFDVIMANAKELFPQPIKRPPATDWPWLGELDRLMSSAPDLSPEAVASARAEVARALQVQRQGWLHERLGIFRARGLDAELVGIDQIQFCCRSCGSIWMIPAGAMPADDTALTCLRGCNVGSSGAA